MAFAVDAEKDEGEVVQRSEPADRHNVRPARVHVRGCGEHADGVWVEQAAQHLLLFDVSDGRCSEAGLPQSSPKSAQIQPTNTVKY